MATQVTERDLVIDRIPDILVGTQRTANASTRRLSLKTPLGKWDSFEQDVRTFFRNLDWSNERIVDWRAPLDRQADQHHVDREHLYCGDEGSVQGRFNQHVLHCLTPVIRSRGCDARFGDGKISDPKTLLLETFKPDFILVNGRDEILVPGEIKTPWTTNLSAPVAAWQMNERNPRRMLAMLGQIGLYMFMANSRYGFFTTYNETIFLQQTDSRLMVSNVIRHHTTSQEVNGNGGPAGRYHRKVSLRECFLFIVLMTQRDKGLTSYPEDLTAWVDGTSLDSYKEAAKKMAAELKTKGASSAPFGRNLPSSKGSQADPKSGGVQPKKQHLGNTASQQSDYEDDLSAKTSKLSLSQRDDLEYRDPLFPHEDQRPSAQQARRPSGQADSSGPPRIRRQPPGREESQGAQKRHASPAPLAKPDSPRSSLSKLNPFSRRRGNPEDEDENPQKGPPRKHGGRQ